MSELGQRLQEARVEKGLSLEDVITSTKIQKRYLIAIEEGRFDALPGKFYARAFVKSYAEAVGLNPEEVLEQFQHELPNPHKEGKDLPMRSERTVKTRTKPIPTHRSKLAKIMPALMTAVFIGVIVVGVWLLGQNQNDTPDVGENIDTQEEPALEGGFSERPAEEPAEVPVEPEEEEVVEEPVEEETTQELVEQQISGKRSYFELQGAEAFEVNLTFSGRSYVGIKNAKGNSFHAQEVADGDELSYDFTAEEQIEFNFGDSRFVEFEINGESFELPLDPNENVHQIVTITFIQAED
nr:RodZ domain-containing protein [Bacillus alkalicellulosilyticus]